MEPGFGEGPVAADGAFGDAEEFGDDDFGETCEEAELDDAGGVGVVGFEAIECGGDFGGVDGGIEGLWGCGVGEVGVDAGAIAAAFFAGAGAGVIDEDLAHGAGGEAEEAGAVGGREGAGEGSVGVGGAELEVDLVDEGGGVEGVAGAFAGELGLGKGSEFLEKPGDGGFAGCGRGAKAFGWRRSSRPMVDRIRGKHARNDMT